MEKRTFSWAISCFLMDRFFAIQDFEGIVGQALQQRGAHLLRYLRFMNI